MVVAWTRIVMVRERTGGMSTYSGMALGTGLRRRRLREHCQGGSRSHWEEDTGVGRGEWLWQERRTWYPWHQALGATRQPGPAWGLAQFSEMYVK